MSTEKWGLSMATRNHQTVYDLVTDSYRRRLVSLGGGSSVGVSIPASIVDEEGLEVGQELVIKEADPEDEAIFEIHGPSN